MENGFNDINRNFFLNNPNNNNHRNLNISLDRRSNISKNDFNQSFGSNNYYNDEKFLNKNNIDDNNTRKIIFNCSQKEKDEFQNIEFQKNLKINNFLRKNITEEKNLDYKNVNESENSNSSDIVKTIIRNEKLVKNISAEKPNSLQNCINILDINENKRINIKNKNEKLIKYNNQINLESEDSIKDNYLKEINSNSNFNLKKSSKICLSNKEYNTINNNNFNITNKDIENSEIQNKIIYRNTEFVQKIQENSKCNQIKTLNEKNDNDIKINENAKNESIFSFPDNINNNDLKNNNNIKTIVEKDTKILKTPLNHRYFNSNYFWIEREFAKIELQKPFKFFLKIIFYKNKCICRKNRAGFLFHTFNKYLKSNLDIEKHFKMNYMIESIMIKNE